MKQPTKELDAEIRRNWTELAGEIAMLLNDDSFAELHARRGKIHALVDRIVVCKECTLADSMSR